MNRVCLSVVNVSFIAFALGAIASCGGGSNSPPPPTYSIGGTVSGLDPGQSIVLQDNGGDNLTVPANGPFTFAARLASGGNYVVTILSQPAGKSCAVSGGLGIVVTDTSSVSVSCGTAYTIGVTVTGLTGQGLALMLVRPRGGAMGYGSQYWLKEVLPINTNGDFAFRTVASSSYYYVVDIDQQPTSPTQRCVRGPIEFTSANVAHVDVRCAEYLTVTNSAASTLSVFSVDATTGAITRAGVPASTGPSPRAIAATADRKFVYALDGGSNDVSAYAFDQSSGALTPVPGSPFATGTNPQALALNGSRLYVANSGSNDLSIYDVDGTGALALVPSSWGSRATGAGPSVISMDPGGNFLYVANTGGSGDISAFQAANMAPISGSPFPSGSDVSSVAFGAGGNFLYAANAAGSTAAIYGFAIKPLGYVNLDPQTISVDPASGALTSLPGFPYALPSCDFIVADQTGAYLYAIAGASLLGYSIDARSGALTALPGFPVAMGASATSVSIDPTNQFLYVANGAAGTVTGFDLDAATGALAPMAGSPFAVGSSANAMTTF